MTGHHCPLYLRDMLSFILGLIQLQLDHVPANFSIIIYTSIKIGLLVFVTEVCAATCAVSSQTLARAEEDHILLGKNQHLEKYVFCNLCRSTKG